MSILDTFFILFKTDAKEAAAEIGEVDKAADKAEAGLDKMDATAKKLGESFIGMAKAFAAPLLALASVGTFTDIAIQRARAVIELDQAASKLNSNVSAVDAFSRSVKAAGGETAGAVDSLTKLGEKLNEAFADDKSGARKDFEEWGFAFKDVEGQALGAVDGMVALAASLENVSRAEALARIKKLGIEDTATIDLLLQGKAAVIEKMDAEKRAGVVTEEQVRIARDYQGQLGRTQNALTSVGNAIMEALLPSMTRGLAAFASTIEWLSSHKTLVTGFFVGVGAAITLYYLPAITAAAAATIAATWPFLAIGAAVAAVGAAFALAYEDVVMFMNGQPSLIGTLADKYEWFAAVVRGVGKAFRALEAGAKAVIDAVIFVSGELIDAAKRIGTAWNESIGEIWRAVWRLAVEIVQAFYRARQAVIDGIVRLAKQFGERFEEIRNSARENFSGMFEMIDAIMTKIKAAADGIRDGFVSAFAAIRAAWDSTIGAIISGINQAIEAVKGLSFGGPGAPPAVILPNGKTPGETMGGLIGGKNALNAAGKTPLGAAKPGGAGVINNNSAVNIGGVTVNTQATDAKGVAAAVKGELSRQLQGTAAQFDDGVAR